MQRNGSIDEPFRYPVAVSMPTTPHAKANPPAPAGTEDLGVAAVRALARASRQLERASDELSLAHYRVLSAIASGDQRASRIATRLTIGKPTISATVESLRQRGLLDRSVAAGDQRVSDLRLTPEGARLLARVETAMVERIKDLCDKAPDGHQLLESLAWLGRAIDESAAERRTVGRR